ncbi:LysE family translocator [Xenophilus sp. Marseille-Q4582]|uniref:LysE family translocator n=1 Tax=Xenophilus sp. Marseille-Q4582 TaxID=2866600 RepID=UPI001CE47FAC|nr:LysE family translocator [Xenophilus sp. Marseille-Q4582]
MTWSNLSLFLVPFLVAAALPGPAQGTFVATVLARGRASALPFVSGMVAGNAVWLVAAIAGLASLALRYEMLFLTVKWIGVAYLLFVAWKLWTSPVSLELADGRKPGGFLAGAALTLGNPKAAVFFGAILPQAFDLTALSFAQAALIVAVGVAVDFAVQGTYLLAATKARRFITTPRHLKAVNRSAAVMICGCAALIARRG